jgi:hypothetical protein
MPISGAARETLAELAFRAALRAACGGNLLECFGLVPDPRDPRGIRHSLALCTAAVLCGNASFEDVAAWAHHAGAFPALRHLHGPATFPLAGPGWLPAVAVAG